MLTKYHPRRLVVEAGRAVGFGHRRRAQALGAAGPATGRLACTRAWRLACAALAECRPNTVVVDGRDASCVANEIVRACAVSGQQRSTR